MRHRLSRVLVMILLLAAACGGSTEDSRPSTELFCSNLSAANNNDAFKNLYFEYFSSYTELVGLLDPIDAAAPTEIAAPAARLAALVQQIAEADHTEVTGAPTAVLSPQEQADLTNAVTAIDVFAEANCGFSLRR